MGREFDLQIAKGTSSNPILSGPDPSLPFDQWEVLVESAALTNNYSFASFVDGAAAHLSEAMMLEDARPT